LGDDVGPETKRNLRSQLRARRDSIPPGLRRLKSEHILSRLQQHPAYLAAGFPAFTHSIGSEVETLPLLRERIDAGKPVLLPKTHPGGRMDFHLLGGPIDRLEKSPFGIPEPDPARDPLVRPEEIDLVVVPGLGFDPLGHRLGMAGGYFDRYLARLDSKAPRLGLAFECQVLEEIPHVERDRSVDEVLTERTRYKLQEMEWVTGSVDETRRLAGTIAVQLSPPCVLRLQGDLGSGKTEFVRGFLQALGWTGRVKSPTFTLENVYGLESGVQVFHLDGYRLDSMSGDDVDRFQEVLLSDENVVLVEWPERLGKQVGAFSPVLHFRRLGESTRRLTWRAFEAPHHVHVV